MLLYPGFFHVLVHLYYLIQYAVCAVGMAIGLMSYQGRHKNVTGHFDKFLNIHTTIHFRILVYNAIQIVRTLCSIIYTETSIGFSTFLYYVKDGFSLTVIIGIILSLILKATEDPKQKKYIVYASLGIDVFIYFVTILCGFAKILTMNWESPDMEYSQGFFLYDLFYSFIIFASLISFIVAMVANFKQNRELVTARVKKKFLS
jgi:hypothetical protein